MSPIVLHAAVSRIALLLCLAAPTSASACMPQGKSFEQLAGDELLEIYQRHDCRSERAHFALALSSRIDSGELAFQLDEREIRFLKLRVRVEAFRQTLQQAERSAIDAALFGLDEYAAQLRAQSETADAEDSRFADIATLLQQLERISAETRAILNGTAEMPESKKFPAMPEWTLQFGSCGTSLMYFVDSAVTDPGSEDAWAAVGREEFAIAHLLATQWLEGIGYGIAPPRLREFGERMLGEEGYEREIAAALASIRIDHSPAGRIAFMPLLGHWLPLPIAYRSWDGKETVTFQTPDELAAWLRPMLLVDRMRD